MSKSKQELLLEPKTKEKFFSMVVRRGVDECWPWKGGHVEGYGWFYIGGGRRAKQEDYAHRVALFYETGKFDGVARHSCDNPDCCNPGHLKWGTRRDNSQDALDRRRAYVGSANSNAKLTEADVIKARELRALGMLYREIAPRFGVGWKTIWYACNGGWPHV